MRETRVRRALILDRAWRALERGRCDVVRFEGSPSIEQLRELKQRVRQLIPGRRAVVRTAYGNHTLRINAVHTPEAGDIERENAILGAIQR